MDQPPTPQASPRRRLNGHRCRNPPYGTESDRFRPSAPERERAGTPRYWCEIPAPKPDLAGVPSGGRGRRFESFRACCPQPRWWSGNRGSRARSIVSAAGSISAALPNYRSSRPQPSLDRAREHWLERHVRGDARTRRIVHMPHPGPVSFDQLVTGSGQLRGGSGRTIEDRRLSSSAVMRKGFRRLARLSLAADVDAGEELAQRLCALPKFGRLRRATRFESEPVRLDGQQLREHCPLAFLRRMRPPRRSAGRR